MSKLTIKALTAKEARSTPVSLVELKVDGSSMTWDGSSFTSDRDIVRNDRFSHVCKELANIDAKVCGEIAIPGSNVQQLIKRENWHKARFYLFDVLEYKGKDVKGEDPVKIRSIIDDILRSRWSHLRSCRRFNNFTEGWDYVEKELAAGRYAEGLMLKDSNSRLYKVKRLQEGKYPVVGFEQGALKGAFVIMMPNGETGKVSGTSVDFVKKYNDLLAANEKPYVEIEFQFLTDRGIPFQPRLRRLDTEANLKAS